jgi:hypothetical protein
MVELLQNGWGLSAQPLASEANNGAGYSPVNDSTRYHGMEHLEASNNHVASEQACCSSAAIELGEADDDSPCPPSNFKRV